MDEQLFVRSGVAAYKSGDLIRAIDYFATAARRFQSVAGLAWLATLLPDVEEQRYCLHQLLCADLTDDQRVRVKQRLLDLGGEFAPARRPEMLQIPAPPITLDTFERIPEELEGYDPLYT